MGKRSAQLSRRSSNRLLLATLFLVGFATQVPNSISTLLLIDISETFGSHVGMMGQITTTSSAVAMVVALAMGVLSVRYMPRTLLLTGLLFYSLSAIGSYLAPNYTIMLITFAIGGAGGALVFPMLGTIIGESLPQEERSRALGLIVAGQPVSFIVGSPIVIYLAARGGWRAAFIAYMLPFVLASAIIVYFGIPRTRATRRADSRGSFQGFRGLLSNKSALACLASAAIYQGSMMTSLTYAISYFREGFRISTEWGSILLSLMMVCAAVGNLVTGGIVARLGRKRSATALTLGMGVSAIVIYNSGLLWLSTVFLLPWALSAGVAYVAGDSLTLDQVPEYRGTLMSMNTLARSLGTTISTMIGGFLILLYGYGVFGIVMGVLGIAASVTYHLFTEEPG